MSHDASNVGSARRAGDKQKKGWLVEADPSSAGGGPVDLEAIIESGLLVTALKGIVNAWRRLRRRFERDSTTLRLDTPPGAHLTIIVIAPGAESHFMVLAAPKGGSQNRTDPG
jgi:hypothetical protein